MEPRVTHLLEGMPNTSEVAEYRVRSTDFELGCYGNHETCSVSAYWLLLTRKASSLRLRIII